MKFLNDNQVNPPVPAIGDPKTGMGAGLVEGPALPTTFTVLGSAVTITSPVFTYVSIASASCEANDRIIAELLPSALLLRMLRNAASIAFARPLLFNGINFYCTPADIVLKLFSVFDKGGRGTKDGPEGPTGVITVKFVVKNKLSLFHIELRS